MGKIQNTFKLQCEIPLNGNLTPGEKGGEKSHKNHNAPAPLPLREIRSVTPGIGRLPRDYCKMVLNLLPLPVLTIDRELKIIFMNRKTKDILSARLSLTPAEDKILFEYFPDSVTGRINVANKTGTLREIKRARLWGACYDIIFVPFPEKYEKQGGIILLNPSE